MPNLNAESLYTDLVEKIQNNLLPTTVLVGIFTGGAWLAERLHKSLSLSTPLAYIDVSLHRDDFNGRGLKAAFKRSEIPVDVNGAHVILVDDVIYTGRTIRAAINELFDWGRPDCIDLAVLVDRGGRQIPFQPTYCAHTVEQPLAANQSLRLKKDESGLFYLRLKDEE